MQNYLANNLFAPLGNLLQPSPSPVGLGILPGIQRPGAHVDRVGSVLFVGDSLPAKGLVNFVVKGAVNFPRPVHVVHTCAAGSTIAEDIPGEIYCRECPVVYAAPSGGADHHARLAAIDVVQDHYVTIASRGRGGVIPDGVPVFQLKKYQQECSESQN